MLRSCRWFLVGLALVLSGAPTLFASTQEERAFDAAANAFKDGMWSRAEVEFAEFAAKYPNSKHVPEAILLQAQADFKQQKYLPGITLLTAHAAQAGDLADQYAYWRGEAQFQNHDYPAAAATFARLAHAFPDSPLQLDAVVNEASARAKLGQWQQAGALLQASGAFQTAARKHPGDARVVRGQLLLAEALFKQKKLPAAATVLHRLAAQQLAPALQWQQTRLLCRVQLASGKTNAALASMTNLLQLAAITGQPEMRAASVAEQGTVLEHLGRDEAALAAYQGNLTNVPSAWQRQAILKIADLAVAQQKFAVAEQSLERFLKQFPDSPATNVAQLTLGELALKHYIAQPATTTNGLVKAEALFSRFLHTCTNRALTGKAYLDRGWCYWLAGNLTNSLVDFEAAAKRLPPSVDQAVARFKTGDVLFALKDYVGARNNYEAVWQDYTNFPAVKDNLAPEALYQTVSACYQLRDMAGTTNALAQILTVYPTSRPADNSVLLAGEELSDLQQPAQARALFKRFVELWPNSPLRPKAELALARTYEQQNNWSAAVGVYDHWMKQFPHNLALLPQVEYARAMANYRAGNGPAAFAILTNFVAQFPTNDWAPIAQYWVGDYFYNKGATNNSYYADAEKNYELLYQNTNWQTLPVYTNLAYQAKLMAGLSAMGRYSYSDAIQYFTNLTSDIHCPPRLRVRALFAYGGALMQEPSPDTNSPLANFAEARQIFEVICQSYPQTEQAALAWGQIGECDLQLAGQPRGAHFYDDATNAYAQVIQSPKALIGARSQAQMGIGLVFEKRARHTTGRVQREWLQKALQSYLNVLYGSNLRDGETADPFWVKKAGLQAADVLETLGEWPQAVNVYRRLEKLFPPLRELLEKRIANAQAQSTPGPN